METESKQKQRKLLNFGDYVYYLHDKIGSGYSSSVYKGYKIDKNVTQTQSDIAKISGYKVALKVMPMNYESEFQKTIVEEQIKILQRLAGQEHIISLLDIIKTKSQICLVTQYCQGGTLKKKIRKQKIIEESKAMNYFRQLVKGYEPIFQANFLHRDIKPDNILLKADKVKIADFGFAIEEQAAKNQTFLVGSPVYMPLQTLKKNKYSHKGDIWSLGITLFQMLFGYYPYRAKTTKELIKQMDSTPVSKLMPKNISADTSQLLLKLLQIDVENRISFPQLKKRLFPNDSISSLLLQKSKIRSPNKNKVKLPSDITQPKRNKSQLKKSEPLPRSTAQYQKLQRKESRMPIKLQSKSTASQQNIQKQTKKQKPNKIIKQDNEILDILLSQLHFCRLMYKVHNRARIEEKKSKKKIFRSGFRNQLFGFIFTKLQDLRNLNCLSTDKSNEFMCSKYYPKISKICKQYTERYEEELKSYQISKQSSFDSLNLIIELQQQIKTIYDKVKYQEKFDHCVEIVILLDYLITIFQLLKLLGRNGIEQFHKHSKIQKIVQAETAQNVRIEHFKAIQNKLKVLKLI